MFPHIYIYIYIVICIYHRCGTGSGFLGVAVWHSWHITSGQKRQFGPLLPLKMGGFTPQPKTAPKVEICTVVDSH